MRNTTRSLSLAVWSTILLIAALIAPARLAAQTSLGTSTVAGTVRDSAGKLVSGAHVALIDTLHGTTRDAMTNGDGGYQFPGIQPGVYSVKVEQPNFQTTTVNNVQVIIDQAATVNAVLTVGADTQVVQVDAEGSTPLLDTVANSLGGVIDNKRVEELPLNGRNFLQLAALIGGTQPNTVSNQTGHDQLVISVAGAHQWLTGYNINGVSTRSPRLGNSSLNLSISAIDQFKIELGFFLPDKGPQVGIVDVLTKAGNNRFHGEVYEYVRNPYFNAHKYFDSLLPPHSKESVKRNQFGFAVGGPVSIPHLFSGKDRFWFFGNYEGTRQVLRNTQTQTVPTPAMFNGDFSALLTQASPVVIFDPSNYNAVTNKRSTFATPNVIPTTQISPLAKALLGYYVPANQTGLVNNLTGLSRNTLRDDQFTVRLDNAISQRQSMYVDFSYQNSPVANRDLQPLKGNGFPLEASLGVFQHTLSIGSHLLNIARIGFDHAYVFQIGEGQGGPAIETQLGIPGTLDPHGIPNIALTGYTGPGNAYSRVGEVSNAYSLNEALSYTRGTHNVSLGIGFVYHRVKQQNANAGAVGSLTFQGNYTSQTPGNTTCVGAVCPAPSAPIPPNKTTSGNAFADFLLGLPQSGSVQGFRPIHYYYSDYYPYIQDSWRVTPHFTLNYGVAYYFSSIPNPQGPDAQLPHSFDFNTGLIKYAALGEVSPQVIENDYNNVMPRLGFVYNPAFDPNTTIRAAVGLYYGQLGLNDIQYGVSAPPFSNSTSFSNDINSNVPATNFNNGGVFPVVALPPLSSAFAAALPNGTSLNIFDQHARTPYVTQWTGSIQHTFGKNDLIQLDYIGNSGHKGTNRVEYNLCKFRADFFCDLTTRPYPTRYSTMGYEIYNTNSSYEAFIAKYQHQFARQLTVLANFTYQKSLTDGFEPNTGRSFGRQNTDCGECEKGPTTFNIPLSFVVSTVYELPFGKGKMFGTNAGPVKDLLIGGWKLSVIGRLDHGTATDVTANNVTNGNGTANRADQLSGCSPNDRDISKYVRTNNNGTASGKHKYINTACFAAPKTGYFGNSKRGAVFNPGQDVWDTSLVKGFTIHENYKMELRGEFFNVFNHANFTSLNLNASAPATFGLVSATRDPRIIQVAGILRF